MTNVFIDHQKFSTQRYGGISRYFVSLIDGIRSSADVSCKVGVLHSQNYYLQNEHLPLNNLLAGPLINLKATLSYRINEFYCRQLLNRQNFDVFHPTYYSTYFLKMLRKPLVVTIHDMTYERYPEYFWAHDPLTYQKRRNIERADAIIAISNSTRNDLIHFFDVDPAKIHVIYHGIETNSPAKSRPIANIPQNYLLYVGDRNGYKNFYFFLRAFKRLQTRYPDLHVILTGGGSLGIAEREYIYRLSLSNRVRHLNSTDEELAFLYQNARCFVYPSLYEGFGLPILEAFRANCATVLSDIVCFREVAGNAAAYFDPTQLDDLVSAIDTVLTDTEWRQQLIRAGAERQGLFPITASVQRTLELYKSLG